MHASRKKNTSRVPGVALGVWLALWFLGGVLFLALGVRALVPPDPSPDAGWLSLVQPNPSEDPGWPFVVIGSLMICMSWAVLLRRRVLLALAPLWLACLLSIGGGTYTAWHQHRKIATYQPVEAWVLRAGVECRVIEYDEGSTHVYTPIVRYEYEVADQMFSSDAVYPMPWSFVDSFESRGLAREVLELVSPGLPAGIHRVGATTDRAEGAEAYPVVAYYDPLRPADSFLIKRYSWLPFAMILCATGPLLVSGFVVVTRSSLEIRRKQAARWLIVAAWHATGLLVASHCLFVVLWGGGMVGPAAGYIAAVYEVIGLVPLGIALPRKGWPGRIKDALAAAGVAGIVVGFLSLLIAGLGGTAAQFVAEFLFHRSINVIGWALLVALILSCAAAVVAAVVELVSGEASTRR
jgi:hypothetical protein